MSRIQAAEFSAPEQEWSRGEEAALPTLELKVSTCGTRTHMTKYVIPDAYRVEFTLEFFRALIFD
jgi:hypothetical protein